MAQANDSNLNWWAKLLKNSPLIAVALVEAVMIIYLWSAMVRANDAIVKCKEDDASTRERILNQSNLNTLKADNIYNRTEQLLNNQREIKEQIEKLKSRK